MSRQVEAQCWLEEHRALRSAIELHFTSIRYLVILNITALGTISGLVLSNPAKNMWLLLIIPILSPVIGFLVYFHSKRMSQLGHYINKKIAPKLKRLTDGSKVIGWESYVRAEERKRNEFLKWFSISGISLLTFILTSVLALIFIAKETLATGVGWRSTLWVIGFVLTIILVSAFIKEREFWFGEENTIQKTGRWFKGIIKKGIMKIWNKVKP